MMVHVGKLESQSNVGSFVHILPQCKDMNVQHIMPYFSSLC